MSNERLKSAMAKAHVDVEIITRTVDVDPKTVQRWLKGRVPHARHRWKLAELLRENEDFLWPGADNTNTTTTHTSEVVAAYAHRNEVPPGPWWQLFSHARKQIDLLGFAMLFLPEQHSGLVDLFEEKATSGCKIRIALADPMCAAVQMRDEEEQLGGTLPARIQTTLYHFRAIHNFDGIEIRYHTACLYNSLFRSDNQMFVTPHLYGLHGSKAPLLHLRCLGPNGIFANFAEHFEAIWRTTQPRGKDE
jgi:hypothetical protein